MVFNIVKKMTAPLFEKWLSNYLPKNSRQSLNSKNIFIIPSKFGAAYLGFIMLLFTLGTNYQNNLILLFVYALASLFIILMFHSFNNLYGLVLEIKNIPLLSVNSRSNILIEMFGKNEHQAIMCFFTGHQLSANNNALQLASKKHHQSVFVNLSIPRRGCVKLPRLQVRSYYPLGLFRCWSHIDFDKEVIVYPESKALAKADMDQLLQRANNYIADKSEGQYLVNEQQIGNEEFYQLARFTRGQSMASVSWKHVARGQGWHIKQHHDQQMSVITLSLDLIKQGNLESKLSVLTYVCLKLSEQGISYALNLPDKKIEVASGQTHLDNCLTALAMV